MWLHLWRWWQSYCSAHHHDHNSHPQQNGQKEQKSSLKKGDQAAMNTILNQQSTKWTKRTKKAVWKKATKWTKRTKKQFEKKRQNGQKEEKKQVEKRRPSRYAPFFPTCRLSDRQPVTGCQRPTFYHDLNDDDHHSYHHNHEQEIFKYHWSLKCVSCKPERAAGDNIPLLGCTLHWDTGRWWHLGQPFNTLEGNIVIGALAKNFWDF